MGYEFRFFGPTVQQGDRCDFYAGFPASAGDLAGEADPIGGTTLGADLLATLSNTQGNQEVAVVLERAGKVYGRSNSLPLSRFTQTGANDLHAITIIEEATLGELSGFLPATPFTEDNITVTSADVDLRPPHLVLTGDATSDGWWFFDFTLAFEYVCGLSPVTVPLWFDDTDYLAVDRIDFSVDGKNILQDVVLLFARGTIRNRLEDALADNLNAEVRDRLSVLDGQAATVSDVTVTSGLVTIEVTLVSPDSLCPLATAARSPSTTRTRDRAQVARLRRIRDDVLPTTTRGREYAAMVATHRPELARLLAAHPDASAAFHATLDRVADEAGRKGMADLSVSAASVDATRRLIDVLAPHASPPLRRDLLAFRARLEGRGDVTARELLD